MDFSGNNKETTQCVVKRLREPKPTNSSVMAIKSNFGVRGSKGLN